MSPAERRIEGDHPARTSLTEQAYARLKHEIMENHFAPGFQATETELAERLGMSRTPLREALLRLQDQGLVEVLPRRGMRVLPMSPADMRDIYQVLACVEAEAVGLIAAMRPDAQALRPLDEATTDMERALERDDLDAWAEADTRYHRVLVGLCPNPRLARIAYTFQDQAHRVRMFTLRLRKKPVQSTQEHRDHLAALLAGDAETAREAYRRHRERATAELMDILHRYRLHSL